eukprot:scaffold16485_cov65-Phaeocystis_antarctica.AAC.6
MDVISLPRPWRTQRTYAIGEAEGGKHALVILDANLQIIAIVEATGDAPEDIDDDDYEPIQDLAVHGDQVIVLTGKDHDKGSGLQLLNLDGRFLSTIAAGQFRNPQAVAVSHGRAFVVDNSEDHSAKVLFVIDVQSGDIWQRVPVDLQGGVSAILVDSDEIYIASGGYNRVVVLRLAGSEA